MNKQKEGGKVIVLAQEGEKAKGRLQPEELGRESSVRAAEINAGESRVLRKKIGQD